MNTRTILGYLSRFWGILAGISALILFSFFRTFPFLAERVYAHFIFRGIRIGLDAVIGSLNVAGVYILFVLLLIGIGWLGWRHKNKSKTGWQGVLTVLNILFFVVFLFYGMWGFNYARPRLETKWQLSQPSVNKKWIVAEFKQTSQMLDSLRTLIKPDSSHPIWDTDIPKQAEDLIRSNLSRVLIEQGFELSGKPRVKPLYPKGLLMRLGISGIYIPFVGEGYFDPGNSPVNKVFTQAHEMSHAWGIGDEGTANFIAWLTCTSSEDPVLQYAGQFVYWRYLGRICHHLAPEQYAEIYACTHAGVIQDVAYMKHIWKMYPELIPQLQEWVNNVFLKSQGVKEGTKSYGRLVELVHLWKIKTES